MATIAMILAAAAAVVAAKAAQSARQNNERQPEYIPVRADDEYPRRRIRD